MTMAAPQTHDFFASLPMYDWPEVSAIWDRLWTLTLARLAADGIDAEAELRRPQDSEAAWRDPRLILGQTCGWPYVSALRGTVFPFARFDFGLGGLPGDYHSVFIAAAKYAPAALFADPEVRVAINGPGSQSGFRALSELASGSFSLAPSRVLVTGSHRASIQAVAEGVAGFAAIDAMSWRLALAVEPSALQVSVCGQSSAVPGLPLITARRLRDRAPKIFSALAAAVDGLPVGDRDTLGLRGVVSASDEDYRVLEQAPFGRVSIAG